MIGSERQAQSEIIRAQKLLEEQNATLEQKVKKRTSELEASNHSLEQRNAALAILNNVSEAMTKTLDVNTILDELAQEAIRLVNGESGFAGFRTADGMTSPQIFPAG